MEADKPAGTYKDVASRSDSAEHKLRTTITAAFLATRLREEEFSR